MDAIGSVSGMTESAAGSAAPPAVGLGGTEARVEMGVPSIPQDCTRGPEAGRDGLDNPTQCIKREPGRDASPGGYPDVFDGAGESIPRTVARSHPASADPRRRAGEGNRGRIAQNAGNVG